MELSHVSSGIIGISNNVTADFTAYALPLIQGETKLEKEDGLPRFARLKKVFAK